MTNFIKQYWIVLLLLFGIGGIYSWYDPNYCYKEGKKYTDTDFKDGQSNSEIALHLAIRFGLANEIAIGLYDKNDTKKLEAEINKFYNKYPNLKSGGVDQKAEPEFYAFRSFQYFFPPKDINKINDYIKKDGWGNRPMKKIIGYEYLQYYGPCGKTSFGMGDEIYEGDKADLDFNPYKKHKNK